MKSSRRSTQHSAVSSQPRHFRLRIDEIHRQERGTAFSVWAPNARKVSVVGGFNGWDPNAHVLQSRGSSGIWEAFIPDVAKGSLYKFHIASQHNGHIGEKADPFGIFHEQPPRTGSVVWDLEYEWSDTDWMESRG